MLTVEDRSGYKPLCEVRQVTKELVQKFSISVLHAVVVVVGYLVLAAINTSTGWNFFPWIVMAVSYGLVSLFWDYGTDSEEVTGNVWAYLLTSAAIAVVVGGVATSSLAKSLASDVYIALFATVLVVPGALVTLVEYGLRRGVTSSTHRMARVAPHG